MRGSTSRYHPPACAKTSRLSADAQPLVETAQVATNFKQNLMSMLPSNRTIDAALLMAPGLHATGQRGAYTINGSQSYENLYTLDGAIINENLRGAPMNPYIEDALQEVTVASAGVSAEYGRFSGGIANAVTKSGGNTFSGSFRTSFANESWRTLHAVRIDAAHRKFIAEAEARQGRADPRSDVRRADRERTCLVLPGLASAAAGIDEDDLLDQHPVHSHE